MLSAFSHITPGEPKIVNPHKPPVTTRKSIRQHAATAVETSVVGLQPQSACDLIRFLSRGNSAITTADNTDFQPILAITEGNPFLIKLTIQRFLLSHKPLAMGMQELKKRGPPGSLPRSKIISMCSRSRNLNKKLVKISPVS